MGTVYLLHFDEPLPRNRGPIEAPVSHYLGFATRLEERLSHHRAGTGARIMRACAKRGIGFRLARVWQPGDRTLERQLKNRFHYNRRCPICQARGRHAVVAISCDGCGRPVCRACQRHLIRVRGGQPTAHWRHSRRLGCAGSRPIAH